MNILNWNIRGMNSVRKRQALSEYIVKHQVDMIAIQETKKDQFSTRILRSLAPKFDTWIFLPSVGRSGGILFGGDSNKIQLISHSLHRYCINLHLANKSDQSEWQYTIVYGPTLRSLKKELWNELDNIRVGGPPLWIISGDFNVIRHHLEKFGTNFDVKISKMFNNFIHRHNLIEHKLSTRKFTWSSGSNFALLDRFFTSIEWDQKYPTSVVTDLCKNGSDHCPLLLQIPPPHPPSLPPFRLDPLWLDQEDFCTLLVKWWQEFPIQGPDYAHSWVLKIGYIRRKIKGWTKNFYGQKKRTKQAILDKLHSLDILQELRNLTPFRIR